MIIAIDQLAGMAKEYEFLIYLLAGIHKALAVRLAYVSEYTDGWVYNALQLLHLAGL